MSDLGWTADGIERAIACGGVPLETYQRPGFGQGKGVRRADSNSGGSGVCIDVEWSADPDPEAFVKRVDARLKARGLNC